MQKETVKEVQSQAGRDGPVALEIGPGEEVAHQHTGLRGRGRGRSGMGRGRGRLSIHYFTSDFRSVL